MEIAKTFIYFLVNIGALIGSVVVGAFLTFTAFNAVPEPWSWLVGFVVGVLTAAAGLTVVTQVLLHQWD